MKNNSYDVSELLVSVLVPAYNVEDYIGKCLDSILAQTWKPLDICVVDDGSTDRTSSICDEYSKKDSRIRVFHQENKGLAETRNVLIQNACGSWIAFVDSDDTVDPDYVAFMMKTAFAYNADIAICGRDWIKENGAKEVCSRPGFQRRRLSSYEALTALNSLNSFDMSAWAKCYRRALFDGIQYPKGKKSEDCYTTFKLLYKANGVVYIDNPLYHYFLRNNSLSRADKANLDYVYAADEQLEYLSKRWKDGKSICVAACLLARMSVYGTVIQRHSPLSKYERAVLLHGNIYRLPLLLCTKCIPISRKIQVSLFALLPYIYLPLYRLMKVIKG